MNAQAGRLMSVMFWWIAGVCCAAAVEKPGGAKLWVPLTVSERAGIERFDEPVTSGIPLPEGLLDDPAKLVLLDPAGKPVPAQFTVGTRWYPGNSIKWVLVDFQASLPANARAVYYLTDAGVNPAPKTPVAVQTQGDLTTFTTGKLKLTIKRKGFNLFDEVWIDETGNGKYDASTQIVKTHAGDGVTLKHGGAVLPDFKHFSPANDPDTTVVVEEAGPMRAVVKISGKHISTDAMPGDNRLLDFDCRITTYADSPLVKVVYSMMCRQGASIADGVPLDRAWLSVPIEIDASRRTWAVGLPNGKAVHPGLDVAREMPPWRPGVEPPGPDAAKFHQAGLEDCWVHADRSDRIGYYGDFFRKRLPIEARGKDDKQGCLTVGWLDLGDETRGVAAGIQWFWQTWPRAVKTDPAAIIVMLHANFQLRPPLMTSPNGPRAHWYPGMSQTSTSLFHFRGKRNLPRIIGAYAGLNKPLRLIAPPAWYCEETQAFGRLASSTPSLYEAETLKTVVAYDERLKKTLDHILQVRDFAFGDFDHYGMFNFGDVIDFIHGNRSNPGDRNVTWDNCYYDYPHALFLQFARTGDEKYLDTAIEAEHHLMDMDMLCWHPDDNMIGCNRYSDGGMHIRQGDGGIYTSPTFNHFKTQSHFERFYFTGERRARDMGLLSARFAMKVNGMGWGEPRSLGHGPLGVLAAWEATGDIAYLKRMREFEHQKADAALADRNPARVGKGRHWQGGIGFEATREYYEHTGDPRALDTLKVLTQHCFQIGDWAESTLHAFAFLGAQTDNAAYSSRARKQIETAGQGITKRDWGYAQSFGNELRNAPYVFWYMTKSLPQKLEPKKMEF